MAYGVSSHPSPHAHPQTQTRTAVLLIACVLGQFACGGDCTSIGGGSNAGADLTLVQLNALHGITGECPQLDHCRLADRIELLFQLLERSGCPDLVTLQEIATPAVELIRARADTTCPFAYEMIMGPRLLGVDDEVILSRYPVLTTAQQPLFPGFRTVLWARVDHPLGAVDVYTTHLASGSDGGNIACTAAFNCPAECLAAGAANRRDCQAVQLAAYVAATHDAATPAVLAGDFNDEPGTFIYRTFADHGWIDTHLAAGNAECDPASGMGCTSGREGDSLVELESPASNVVERIDFVFLLPPQGTHPCALTLDPATDRDGDGIGTGLFAAEPNPFAASCGPAPAAICWPSDHQGVALDANCAR